MLDDIITIILAGGTGTRLMPLTEVRAKPAVPFGGKYRIIDFTLSNCINSKLSKMYVLTQYKSHSLNNHLAYGWSFLPRTLDQFIENVPAQMRTGESWYQGTADAVRQNIELIKNRNPKKVLILSGDHIYKMDYRQLIKFHEEKDADLTISAVRVPIKEASDFGILQADKNQKVVDFEEKPKEPKPMPENPDFAFSSMGVYLFNYNVLEEMLRQEGNDFGKHIIPKMIKEKNVYSFDFNKDNRISDYEYRAENGKRIKVLTERTGDSGYWWDVGSLTAFWQANMDLVGVNPEFNLYGEIWPIHTFQADHPPTKTVFNDSNQKGEALNSLVCDGVIISGARVEGSIISPETYIHRYCQIDNSVIMGGDPGKETSIGRSCHIKNAIIDKNVEIDQGVTIGYDINEDRGRGFTIAEIDSFGNYITVIRKGSVVSR
ncbi:MAG: glucose-1-phosphate adenylyltransferase [Candidatus Woesearchaeota archaeon]|nr:glucose-1-phosphate adenylyltransferase [Candidatus Woesearchaeota archaeon]